ncbi:MAG TPA: M24 family metallopeptidase [Planctomycetia bacterium]|nr:M24 family metallopeptidase [Planctomycetia bacterium]
MKLAEIQAELLARKLDGWLFYDFRGSDPLAKAILKLPEGRFTSRRWFYYVPAKGTPQKLVHAIEPGALEPLPGEKTVYLPWPQLHSALKGILAGAKKIAMQYSPMNNIPYVSRVDAGTIELVRSFGVEIVTSAELVQLFEATIDEAGYKTHCYAADCLGRIVHDAFKEVRRRLDAKEPVTEYGIQQFIGKEFEKAGLEADHLPIVGVNEHAADPHFAPDPDNDTPIREGDWLLIDLWAKEKKPGAVYGDITWTGFVGKGEIPAEIVKVFTIVRDARDAAVKKVNAALAAGERLRGCDVDDACRKVIADAGYGDYFIHRTGHSIKETTHGNGTHIDNLETFDDRPIAPKTCFSIEPGVYLTGKFGVRSEINVFVKDVKTAEVTGIPAQKVIVRI